MKAAFEHIESNQQKSSFKAYSRRTEHFDFNWHYHPELELTFIESGSGTRLVGDHTEVFTDGDLVLLGGNLPHTWVSELNSGMQSAIVLQFASALISEKQSQIPEFAGIKKLFLRAHHGLSFGKNITQKVQPMLYNILNLDGLRKLTELWLLLDLLGQSGDYRELASPIYRPSLGKGIENRLDIACQHIHEHFTRKISLPEIASIVGMTETSFCRFFKKMTGKSFTHYINDLRVSRARKLLVETDTSISEVAFASGFESMTHFNRTFLKRNGAPPREYRKMFKKKSL